jgi:signal transduction histidine kinase
VLRQNARDKAPFDYLAQVVSELDEHLDRLARELRPSALDDFGLETALTNLVDAFSSRHGVSVDFQCTGAERGRLPPVVETTLYRIVQEALTNVAKHARATSASVILDRRRDDVQVIIEDNGKGFDRDDSSARRTPDRLGLPGMRERVALVGGTLNIESSVDGGTSVFARITLAEGS